MSNLDKFGQGLNKPKNIDKKYTDEGGEQKEKQRLEKSSVATEQEEIAQKQTPERENVFGKVVTKSKEQGLEKPHHVKVVLCGPPHSGKSCLREGLKKAVLQFLQKHNIDQAKLYPYVITASPDGEGAWFQETVKFDSRKAMEYKESYKSKFNPEFVKRVADSVKSCNLPLTLIDVGGRPSEENKIISEAASHAIILSGDREKMVEWRDFCNKTKLKIIAEILSDYQGKEDNNLVLDPDGVWRGSVHYLERGETVSGRPTIKKLAEVLVEIAMKTESQENKREKEDKKEERYYQISLQEGNILKIGFGEPAQNDLIVKSATARLNTMIEKGELPGGSLLKINGPASLPVAVAIAHKIEHLYETIAVYDPKLSRYVVSVAHETEYKPGDLIE